MQDHVARAAALGLGLAGHECGVVFDGHVGGGSAWVLMEHVHSVPSTRARQKMSG